MASGLKWGLGNREANPETAAWVHRAQRAHANLVGNLPAFAILVLVAHMSGNSNDTTALGATIFFFARVGHAASYIAGIVVLRTALFYTGIAGEVLILSQLL